MQTVRKRTPSPAMLVALLALFVALGGVTYAATKLEKNSVKSKHIKDGHVRSNDVANGGVAAIDLADGSVSAAKVANDAVGTGQISDGAVGTSDIADNAVNSAKVAADSLAAGDLAPGSVGTSEVVNNSLDQSDIAVNGVGFSELDRNSVRAFQANAGGAPLENFGPVATDSCASVAVNISSEDGNITDDAIAVTAPVSFAGNFSLHAEASDADTFLLKACNNGTTNPQDPDGAGGGSYRFISFDT